jgi:hypothetical protein
MRTTKDSPAIETIGSGGRYYETMVFGAKQIGPYMEADVSDERVFNAEWAICANSEDQLPEDVDNKANEMHERVVAEFVEILNKKDGNIMENK